MIKGSLMLHLGPIWYHSEPSDVPYFPNQFLRWDLFCRFFQLTGSSTVFGNMKKSCRRGGMKMVFPFVDRERVPSWSGVAFEGVWVGLISRGFDTLLSQTSTVLPPQYCRRCRWWVGSGRCAVAVRRLPGTADGTSRRREKVCW